MSAQRVIVHLPAGAGQRFAADQFASSVGRVGPVLLDPGRGEEEEIVIGGLLVGAEVAGDGSAVALTFELRSRVL